MMMMRRREGEKILIGDHIVIHITHVGRNRVRIGIDAPRELPIVAEEIRCVAEANQDAASTRPSDLASLLGRLQLSSIRTDSDGPSARATSGT